MDERNAAICAYYKEGHNLRQCASRFKIGRQRVLQILQAAKAWHPYVKSGRTKHLGVTVTEETKRKLEELAARKDASVSRYASDRLEEVVAQETGE